MKKIQIDDISEQANHCFFCYDVFSFVLVSFGEFFIEDGGTFNNTVVSSSDNYFELVRQCNNRSGFLVHHKVKRSFIRTKSEP